MILPSEIEDLQNHGITRIYSPDDGRAMGLQGMINDLLEKSDFPTGQNLNGEVSHLKEKDARSIGRLISAAENFPEEFERVRGQLSVDSCQLSVGGEKPQQNDLTTDNQQLTTKRTTDNEQPTTQTPILGITGTGGAGKSSLVDELVRRFLLDFPEKTIAIISVDPSKRKTGGALLGDRIRMNAIN